MKALSIISLGLICATALAAPTATLTLTSPQAGQSVAPGANVSWEIRVAVSSGDNAGLALVSVNLVQAGTNPEKFDIPFASGVPAGMANFSRPQGISNPGEGGNPSGYVGVQRGTAGQRNLIQIGGGQNTFGAPGGTIGTSFNPVGGIGQGAPQLVAAGSFAAPNTAGSYTFSLQAPLVNVITTLNSPPAFSPVASIATQDINLAGGSFTFTVEDAPVGCAGDVNCDGAVTFSDIDLFVEALSFPGGAGWPYPNCPWLNADANGDNDVTFSDIDPFVNLIGTNCP